MGKPQINQLSVDTWQAHSRLAFIDQEKKKSKPKSVEKGTRVMAEYASAGLSQAGERTGGFERKMQEQLMA